MVNAMFTGPRRGPGIRAALFFLTLSLSLVEPPAAAQMPPDQGSNRRSGNIGSAQQWVPPRTAWGDPDLRGIWTGFENLPLERPLALGDKAFFTEEELAQRVERARERARERQALIAEGKVEHQGFRAVPNYNAIWGYSGREPNPRFSKRTSAIVDPPSGRIPPWTLEQVRYWEAREAMTAGRGESDTVDDINLNTRCINVVTAAQLTNWGMAFGGANATAPGRPDAPVVGEDVQIGDGYGVNASPGPARRIMQSPGYVAFVMGDIPVHRVVRLGGRPHPSSKIRQWMGDAQGHFDGTTLVIDIANITFGSPIIPNYGGALYPGSGETLRVIERFTPIDESHLEYRYTIEDPKVYVQPYTVLHMLRKSDSRSGATTICREDPKDRAYMLSNSRGDEQASLESGEDSVNARKPRFEQLRREAIEEAARANASPTPGSSADGR